MNYRCLLLLCLLPFTSGLSAFSVVAICRTQVNVSIPADACTVDVHPRWIDSGSYDSSGNLLSSYTSGGNGLGPGTYTVGLTVYNRNGSNSCFSTVVVVDNITPDIDCHNQVYYFFEPDQDVNIILDDYYSIYDNCPSSLEQSISLPLLEDYGIHQFSASATEADGDVYICLGTIDVRDPEPQNYCSSNRNSYYEHIASVEVNSSNIPVSETSGDDGGYAWHYPGNNSGKNFYHGFNYTMSYEPGFRFGTPYHEYWSVYLDKNLDGDFTDAGELLHQWNGYGGNSFDFVAPSTGWGWTRMRVVMSYSGYAPPCGGGYGETEDISVYLRRYFYIPWPGFKEIAPETDLSDASNLMTALNRPVQAQSPAERARRAKESTQLSASAPLSDARGEIVVYPNPVAAGGNIQVSGHDKQHPLTLYNLNGKQVGQYSGEASNIPLATNLPAGLYLLNGTDDTGQEWTQRVIIR